MKRFRKNQMFRVVTQNVHFFASAAQIRRGVGDEYVTNASIQKALDALEYQRNGAGLADQCASGIAGNWEGRNVQLDVTNPNQVI